MHSRKSQIIFFFFFLFSSSLIFNITTSDDAKDKEECTNEVVGLATCLPYVEGLANAKSPTPNCCSGLKELLKTNKMCLCLVVKHRNDPDLGLNINATLALGLPSVCHLQANATECPVARDFVDLLHLDPKSPDAQIFYNYGNSTSKNVSSSASSPISTGGSGAPRPRVEAQNSNSDHSGKRWFKGEAIIMTILLLCYYVSF